MKKIKCILLSSFIVFFSLQHQAISSNLDSQSKDHREIDLIINRRDSRYDIPEISGEVYNLPWKNDKDFLKTKEKYNSHLLLAGFCAVLSNPLPGEEYNVNLGSRKVKGQVVKPGKVFSQNLAIGPYTKLRGFREGASYIGGNIRMTEGGGVCKIASSLYNLAVLSNLEILERHNHSMPINYVPYGQDATVAYGIKDLQFKNTSDSPILIWSEMIDNRLYMAFYGSEKPPKIVWNHEITNIIEPSIKYIKNEDLKTGEMKVLTEGMKGATVKSTIRINYRDGHYLIKNMGSSYYQPLPKLIEIK